MGENEMIKRITHVARTLILLVAVLALPSLGSAQTYWAITASSSPTGYSPTPIGFTPVGNVIGVTDPTTTYVDFALSTNSPAGYTLTSVTVDGVRVKEMKADGVTPETDGKGNYVYVTTGTFRVNKGTMLNHNIIANYTAYASNTYTIKSIPTAGGWISPSQTVAKNGSAKFTITANPGSTLIDILVDGVSTNTKSGSYTISNVTGNHTIQPVFDAVKSLSAVISIPPAMSVTPGKKILVVGNTKPAFASGVTFTWSATNGAIVGAQVISNGMSTVEITAPATGTFSVGLDVAVVGQPVAAPVTSTVTVTTPVNSCLGCHDGVGGPDNSSYIGSKHDTKITCQNCHNPNNDLSHAYKPVKEITCGTTSCHTAPSHGDIASNNCNTCHDKHSLQVTGSVSCDFCHGNPPPTKTFGVSTYTHVSATCSDCHSVPPTAAATGTHRDGGIEILTNNTACAACHSYPPAGHVANGYNAVAGTTPNCSTCHTFTGFNGPTHNNGTVDVGSMSCTSCHGNPPQVLTMAKSGHTGQHLNVTNCDMCHGAGAADGSSSNHKNGTINTLKSGAPHFNNVTSGMYPAAYVTSTSTCANCHNVNANNQTIRQQWAASGHGNTAALPWIDYDFKTRSECVRCHTTTGFIAYSTAKLTAAWGQATDKTKEVLTCVGCHSDVANGVVRTVTPNKPFADEQTFTNADVGTSNICMDCHSGRNNGASIQAKVTAGANFANLSYIAPHYLTAGGSLQGKSGFHFPGRTYAALSENAHSKVGTANSNNTGSNGPCVACHMSATAKHTFSPVTETNGAITAITTNACANCHSDSSTFNASVLDAKKVAFTNALAVLKAALADKGIVVTDNYPYVALKNWGTGQAGANLMGAAFNYKLFAAEPGAYAHNPEYAKQLIADSIEAVATGGSVTGSDISGYLGGLVSAGKVTADQASSLNSFTNTTSSCASCHSFPPATASHASATTSPINCANCHIYTGVGGATHNNGTLDFGAMTCTSCHPTLSASHAVHVGNLPTLVTAYGGTDTSFMNNNTDSSGYKFGCVTCHPSANANHKNGTIVLSGVNFTGTTKSNITCATSCHYSTVTPNWYTGFTGTDRCAMCHAAAPATGSHTAHINNGIHEGSSGITYAATLSCAKCHADTVDGSKNINYLNHINGVVNVAFVAASEVSKAQISAASFNAYSTVWTRTGATDTSKKFLSAGNYANGTCSTIACHNNGTTPAWGSGPLSCVACHSQL